MAWHLRPGAVAAFPSGSAADWATEWFTPIDAAHLNYLGDNLTFLRNPPRDYVETTPGTTFVSTDSMPATPGAATVAASGTLVDFSAGKTYLLIHCEYSVSAGNSGALYFRLDGSGGSRYLTTRHELTASVLPLGGARSVGSAVYKVFNTAQIIDTPFFGVGDLDWTLFVDGHTSMTVKNVRVYLREL